MKRLVKISKKYLKLLCGVKDKQPEPLPPPSLSYFQQGDQESPVPTLVIAGNYEQYQDCLARNSLNPARYRYISKPEDIRGYRKVRILRVGQYWRNPMDMAPWEFKILEIVSEDYEKLTLRPGQLIEMNEAKGYTKRDGSPLTMGDMGAQADQRNAQGQLGSMLGSGLLGQQNLLAQAFAGQQQQASQRLLDALGSQQAGIALKGLIGDIFGSGNTVFASGPTFSVPKPQREIPIQEPVGKRRIKLRD